MSLEFCLKSLNTGNMLFIENSRRKIWETHMENFDLSSSLPDVSFFFFPDVSFLEEKKNFFPSVFFFFPTFLSCQITQKVVHNLYMKYL